MASACGSRNGYQAGCRCLPCRAANANYSNRYRARWRTKRPPLGTLISARATRQKVDRLLQERFTKAGLARLLGSRAKEPHVRLPDVITLRKALAVQRLYRSLVLQGADGPDEPLDSHALDDAHPETAPVHPGIPGGPECDTGRDPRWL